MNKIAKEVLEALVPEEDAVMPRNLLSPLDHQVHDGGEVANRKKEG